MAKELKSKLIAEAKESIVRVICHVSINYNIELLYQCYTQKVNTL